MEHAAGEREVANRRTRMRFEQWAKNAACEANTISAVRNVRMADVARAEGLEPSFGQSEFALGRGNQFENSLFDNGGERILHSLVAKEVLLEDASGLVDFRLRANGGPRLTSLDTAIEETSNFLTRLAENPSDRSLPALAAAPTLRIPRGILLPEAVLIIDALAIRYDSDVPELVVGEIKTYPDRGGYTSQGELAVARAQAGVYVHGLDVVCQNLGIADALRVRRDGFLVLTRPGSNWPAVRPNEDLAYQAERARHGFELLERAAELLPADVWADSDGPTPELVEAVIGADTAYSESCLSFCDRAPGCYQRARDAGDPIILGEEVRRFSGGLDLNRIVELMNGARPDPGAEQDFVERFQDSQRMIL